MRRRVVRDIGTFIGVIVILGVVVFINGQMQRGTLKDQMEKVRRAAETKQRGSGVDLLSWDTLRKTTGTRRTGPSFDKALVDKRGGSVSLIGFMVPLYDFRDIKEFILLPVPIECYFCQAPPMRDVMLVQMAAGKATDLAKEPVIISGELTLNEGPGTKFFYVIKDATRGAAEKCGKLTKKKITSEHTQH
ncbi:MAG: DUF3299 domain-containing protein, partial [Candidatus Hydrogenedentes bacterium]|nr:DUF3299 domain-containing protein [Candidatus Hydrogenedentota bacterium]